MKKAVLATLPPLLAIAFASAQTNDAPNDAKPATSNVPGQQYPQVDSERRAHFRISAPQANSVSVSLGGNGGTKLTKGDNGYWTGTTPPLAPGFHYYTVTVDGFTSADPGSDSFFGTGKMSSAIEVPSPGEDF